MKTYRFWQIKDKPVLKYGHDKTIHQTTKLDVEVDANGKVVGVWFRCMALPFQQVTADRVRALEMESMYHNNVIPELLAVEVKHIQ